MKRIVLIATLIFPMLIWAQSEYRFTGTYLGNTGTGLRNIKLDLEIIQNGKWKWLHKANIATGLNLELATVESDTNYDFRSWNDLMQDKEIKPLYTHFMDTYLQRIDSKDQATINTPVNKTNNTITVDLSNRVLTVQVRGVEGDNTVWIDICSLDNQYFIMYNKTILPYSANLLDLSTVKLKAADYLVTVQPNKGEKFSAKVSIY